MKIKAAIIRNANDMFSIEDVELEGPHSYEILIKVDSCGFCHTDELVRTQSMSVGLPIVLGYEGCGVVQEVGA